MDEMRLTMNLVPAARAAPVPNRVKLKNYFAVAPLPVVLLKKDEVYLWEYETFNDAIERISYFIEEVYNKKRVHSGIGYLPPVEFENLLKGKENEINQNNGQSGCSNNQPQTVQA